MIDKAEIKQQLSESLIEYLKKEEESKGVKIIVVLSVKNGPVWGLYGVTMAEKREKNLIENYSTEGFFKKVILSQAENLAVKIQVKTVFSTIGKTVFPEVEKGITENLPLGHNIMIARVGEELLLTLNEGERFVKKLKIDEII